MYSEVLERIKAFDESSISAERKELLLKLVDIISKVLRSKSVCKLNFICTHNSRRSHLAQVWSHTLANYYNLNIESYSGGTEATAVYNMVIRTLKTQGFEIGELDRESNSLYFLKFGMNTQPLLLFSKKYEHSFNPKSDFIAVMTCSDADENCPIVSGALQRFPLTFEDPKKYDNTEISEQKYLERSQQIATELHFVFKRISKF
jgi:arsenate reductase